MFGIPLIDIIVIVVYFSGMVAIGLWSSLWVKNQEDYFLGGRRFGKFIQTFAAFGQGTSVDTAVGVITTTITNGASGIWSSLLWLFATPFYWFVGPWMRRIRTLTMADFFAERYGSKRMAGFYSIIGIIGTMAFLAVGFVAMVKTILPLSPKSLEQLTVAERREYLLSQELDQLQRIDVRLLTTEQKNRIDKLEELKPQNLFSHIDETFLMAAVCGVTILYVLFGGLIAAYLTDMVQGIFIILLSVIMLPFGFAKINSVFGGSGAMNVFEKLHQYLPESYFELFGSPNTVDFTWYYIAALAVMSTMNVVVQPNMLVSMGSAKDEHSARFGFVAGSFMKRFCIVGWGVFALLAVLLYRDKVNNPDLIWGYATQDLLAPLNLGLVGLMIACLLAALMSTATMMMLTCAGLFTRNIYLPLFPNRSPNHYLWVGRIVGVVTIVGGAMFAMRFEKILQILKFIWEFNVIVAAAFWVGLKWRRANRIGAWASMAITFVFFYFLPILIPFFCPSLRTNAELLSKTRPVEMVRQYQVRQMDADERVKEIALWEQLNAAGNAEGTRPEDLTVGRMFEKKFLIAGQGIFWTQGIKTDLNGGRMGKGDLNLELWVLHKLGFDLADNTYAMNETLRLIIRTLVPLLTIFLVSLVTRPDDKQMLDRFFAKMLTKVNPDHAQDAKEVSLSIAEPSRFNHNKLFPNSNWEFEKWDKDDAVGFAVCIGIVLGIIALLKILISIGG